MPASGKGLKMRKLWRLLISLIGLIRSPKSNLLADERVSEQWLKEHFQDLDSPESEL
jgi:hypothetical protein